jgi:chitinase
MRYDPTPSRTAPRLPRVAAPDPTLLPDPPQQRLSPARLLLGAVLLAVVVAAGVLGVRRAGTSSAQAAAAPSRSADWFSPYVDVTLTPTLAFQSRRANPSGNVTLGFVVAAKDDGCTPSWGTYHSLDGAASELDLDRRVAQLRGQGGTATVSFGGQANRELAVACDDQEALTSGYRDTLARYAATTADFDVEGTAVADAAANVRRAKAIRALQTEAKRRGGRLAVWLTLPVAPDGLRPEALALVRTTLGQGVDLAGVNVMAMDFGGSAHEDMVGSITKAATATHEQLGALYAGAGQSLDEAALWRRVGVTVMIGQNDVPAERLTVEGAATVAAFARRSGVGRLSMWSLNRDVQCGVTFPMVGTLSNLCSGVRQKPLQFSRTLGRARGRVITPPAAARTTATDAPRPRAATAREDDPAKSPYPVWSPREAYVEGYKVVWHQAVYQARWYTQGQTPDAPTDPANHPWTLVGPVLESDRAPVIPKAKPGTHPAWRGHRAYGRGAKVLRDGLPYRAKWYTQGDAPGEPPVDGTPSPWQPLFTAPGQPKVTAAG